LSIRRPMTSARVSANRSAAASSHAQCFGVIVTLRASGESCLGTGRCVRPGPLSSPVGPPASTSHE
jgi:hypothetical protein